MAQLGPQIYIQSPSDGAIETTTFTFSTSVSTPDGIHEISLSLDNGTCGAPCNLGTFYYSSGTIDAWSSVNVNPGSFSTGTHTLSVYALATTTISSSKVIYVNFGSSSGGCVAINTPILMADGTKKVVQTLKIGDLLTGFDYENSQPTVVELYNISATIVSQLLDINDGFLRLTPDDQPIFIKNGFNTSWIINPRDLKIGEEMFNPMTNTWITIYALNYVNGSYKVFDIETAPYNNFIANGVLLDKKVQ